MYKNLNAVIIKQNFLSNRPAFIYLNQFSKEIMVEQENILSNSIVEVKDCHFCPSWNLQEPFNFMINQLLKGS